MVQDVSVTEAIPIGELDEAAIRAGHSEAVKALGAAKDGSADKAIAQIEVDTFVSMARAINATL